MEWFEVDSSVWETKSLVIKKLDFFVTCKQGLFYFINIIDYCHY
jgi:hypothetical protein